MQITVGATTIRAEQGDLTTLDVDAIVNAANRYLQHGGGLAAAILRAGGAAIQEESDRWIAEHGPLSPDSAAVTGSGAMPSGAVIHVAGPVYRDGQDNPGLLRAAVRAALRAAAAGGHRSVALPAISTGIFGYPVAEATREIAAASIAFAVEHQGGLDEIRLVGFNGEVAAAFAAALEAGR